MFFHQILLKFAESGVHPKVPSTDSTVVEIHDAILLFFSDDHLPRFGTLLGLVVQFAIDELEWLGKLPIVPLLDVRRVIPFSLPSRLQETKKGLVNCRIHGQS